MKNQVAKAMAKLRDENLMTRLWCQLAPNNLLVVQVSLWSHETYRVGHYSSHWQFGRWKNILHFIFYEVQAMESFGMAYEHCHMHVCTRLFHQGNFFFHHAIKDLNDGDKVRVGVNAWTFGLEFGIWTLEGWRW